MLKEILMLMDLLKLMETDLDLLKDLQKDLLKVIQMLMD